MGIEVTQHSTLLPMLSFISCVAGLHVTFLLDINETFQYLLDTCFRIQLQS